MNIGKEETNPSLHRHYIENPQESAKQLRKIIVESIKGTGLLFNIQKPVESLHVRSKQLQNENLRLYFTNQIKTNIELCETYAHFLPWQPEYYTE